MALNQHLSKTEYYDHISIRYQITSIGTNIRIIQSRFSSSHPHLLSSSHMYTNFHLYLDISRYLFIRSHWSARNYILNYYFPPEIDNLLMYQYSFNFQHVPTWFQQVQGQTDPTITHASGGENQSIESLYFIVHRSLKGWSPSIYLNRIEEHQMLVNYFFVANPYSPISPEGLGSA